MVRRMLAELRNLPAESIEAFTMDARTSAAAESFLRRGLEALFDFGRHLLAKGFGRAPAEYKAVALELHDVGVLDAGDANLLAQMAGYRNRLVHFYYEVQVEELYSVCAQNLPDIERIVDALQRWIDQHPEKIDQRL